MRSRCVVSGEGAAQKQRSHITQTKWQTKLGADDNVVVPFDRNLILVLLKAQFVKRSEVSERSEMILGLS